MLVAGFGNFKSFMLFGSIISVFLSWQGPLCTTLKFKKEIDFHFKESKRITIKYRLSSICP